VPIRKSVSDLLKGRAPHAVCDDCITKALNLPHRRQASSCAMELAERPLFWREKDVCTVCFQSKMVIGYGQERS
jgi:hypothetical protein